MTRRTTLHKKTLLAAVSAFALLLDAGETVIAQTPQALPAVEVHAPTPRAVRRVAQRRNAAITPRATPRPVERRMQLVTVRLRFDTDDEFCRTLFYSGALQIIRLDSNALARPLGAQSRSSLAL
jgi:hypothetical protein